MDRSTARIAGEPIERPGPWVCKEPAITRLDQVHEQQPKEIEYFFRSYNLAQGREFRITGRGGARQAQTMFRAAVSEFEKPKGK